MNKTAIILGSTGLTGGLLLDILLNDDRYKSIILFNRKPIDKVHPKINEMVIDLFNLIDYKDYFIADEVYCCIGTTATKTPNKEVYHKIDYGIPVTAAKLCKINKIETFLVISSLGADINSKIFYSRTKGEMENAVLDLNIKNTYILQPSMIGGQRNESRPIEFVFKHLMKLVNPLLIGKLRKYRTIHPSTIAKAMVILANNKFESTAIESDIINQLVKEDDRN